MTTDARYPMPKPQPDATTQFFWDGVNEGRLMILQCQDCGHYIHWPKPICTKCLSDNLAPNQVSGRGAVYSFGVSMQAFHPGFADKIPFVLAVVELEEQKNLKLVTNITDCDEGSVSVGMPVEVAFTEVDEGLTLPLFKPAAR